MNSVYEFGVYLTHFCNVDLFRQGLYFFRVGVYRKESGSATADSSADGDDGDGDAVGRNDERRYALPYRTMMGKQHERDFLIRCADRPGSAGHIDDVTSSYCSSVFRVQYQEQKVRLNEGCLFRLDLAWSPPQRVYISIELVFCELHASDYKTAGFPPFEEFSIVDQATLCLEDCYHGVHSVYPVTFSTAHFCLVHCQVHGELINFKFIPPPPPKESGSTSNSKSPPSSRPDATSNAIPNPIVSESLDSESTMNAVNALRARSGQSSLAEVLFSERVDAVLTEREWDLISEHHQFYMLCLLHTHCRLKQLVDRYFGDLLDDVDADTVALQKEFEGLYPVPDLQIDAKMTPQHRVPDHSNDSGNGRQRGREQSHRHQQSVSAMFGVDSGSMANGPSSNLNGNINGHPSENGSERKIVWLKRRFGVKERSRISGRSICQMVGEEVHSVAGQVFRIWHFLLSLIPFCKKMLTAQLMKEWESHFVERWGAAIFRETLTVRARLRVVSTSLSEHEMISRTVRSQSTFKQLQPPPLQDTVYMIDPKEQAVIFEQSYNLPDDRQSEAVRLLDRIEERHKKASTDRHSGSSSSSSAAPDSSSGSSSVSGSASGSWSKAGVGGVDGVGAAAADSEHECLGKHLFVLVHGYQGNSWDMRMFRNRLLVKCPDDVFLMSECNEKESLTEGDISEMGSRLAAEIVSFIDLHILSQRQSLCRMSFITHSLGGIIAREALSNRILRPYLSRCHTFISLAVCHCGYLFGRSKALQAGFWVMRSWKKSLCLSQLSLTDHENPRKTYLYKLSEKPALKYFENVLLVSSPEDRYTPYHSTRIEMHRKTVQDTKWGRIYNEMVRNLLRPLDHVNLTRFDVSFVHKKVNLDSIIGRSAHICFLEQPLYIDMLIHVYKKYFVSTKKRKKKRLKASMLNTD